MTSLKSDFFNRSADVVARELIGTKLCVRNGRAAEKFLITETEAYMGPHDLACHASKGRTKRTEVMFKKAGTIYVYLIYGMYDMLNIVTGEQEHPAAVLIRGAGTYDGPGKLTKALGINRTFNGRALGRHTGLWVEATDADFDQSKIIATPRIGIAYAKEWAERPLRFVIHE